MNGGTAADRVPGAAGAGLAKERRASFVQVDLGAIGRNTARFKHLIAGRPGCRLMAVVKADAYGHGAVPVAERALAQGADWLGVALPQEALALRQAGIDAPIMVLGVSEPSAYPLLLDADIRLTVASYAQGAALARAARAAGRRANVHIKVDSGMGRLGFWPDRQAAEEILALARMKELVLEGCFSHFARADEGGEPEDAAVSAVTGGAGGTGDAAVAAGAGDAHWRRQFEVFQDFLQLLRGRGLEFPMIHCANTAAGLRSAEARLDMLRLGIGLYGLYPSAAARAWGIPDLEPALSWKSALSHVKILPRGAGVSYGHIWTAPRDTLVGTVPLGYADGFPRALSNRGRVLVRGQCAPVIGRVCMDQFIVDLTLAPRAEPGDEVVLIGRQGGGVISADDVAGLLGSINYEVVCMIGARVPRRYE